MPPESTHRPPALPIMDLPLPPAAKPAPSRTRGTSPQHPPLFSTVVGHHTLTTLFRISHFPPLPRLRSPQPSTSRRPGSQPSLWMPCGSFSSMAPQAQGCRTCPQPFSHPRSGLSWPLHPTASALPRSSLQNLSSGPEPCLTLMSSLHPTSGMDSPPTRHMASYSSRLSARYPRRCLSPLHPIPARPARTWATAWHSRPSPAGTCCCTSSTPGTRPIRGVPGLSQGHLEIFPISMKIYVVKPHIQY